MSRPLLCCYLWWWSWRCCCYWRWWCLWCCVDVDYAADDDCGDDDGHAAEVDGNAAEDDVEIEWCSMTNKSKIAYHFFYFGTISNVPLVFVRYDELNSSGHRHKAVHRSGVCRLLRRFLLHHSPHRLGTSKNINLVLLLCANRSVSIDN